MPLPIGEPSGITAAQPTSTRRRASTGSSVVYGQHDEALVDELLGGAQQLGRVGQQRVLVADHLELDPVGVERLARELRGQDGVAGGVAAGRVRQQLRRPRRRARRSASRRRAGAPSPRAAAPPSPARSRWPRSPPRAARSDGNPPRAEQQPRAQVRPAIVSGSSARPPARAGLGARRRSDRRAARTCPLILPASPSAPRRARSRRERERLPARRAERPRRRPPRRPRARPRPRRRARASTAGHRLASRHIGALAVEEITACPHRLAGQSGRRARRGRGGEAQRREGAEQPRELVLAEPGSSSVPARRAGARRRPPSAARAGCRCGGARRPHQPRQRAGADRRRVVGGAGTQPEESSSISSSRIPGTSSWASRSSSYTPPAVGSELEAALLDRGAEHVATVGARNEIAALEAQHPRPAGRGRRDRAAAGSDP